VGRICASSAALAPRAFANVDPTDHVCRRSSGAGHDEEAVEKEFDATAASAAQETR